VSALPVDAAATASVPVCATVSVGENKMSRTTEWRESGGVLPALSLSLSLCVSRVCGPEKKRMNEFESGWKEVLRPLVHSRRECPSNAERSKSIQTITDPVRQTDRQTDHLENVR
jgi:hypothetical protein